MSQSSTRERFTKRTPCPICGGYDDRGLGDRRCHGFRSGDWVHCRDAAKAPGIEYNPTSDTYAHLWSGAKCFCGIIHDPDINLKAKPTMSDNQTVLKLVAKWDYFDLNGYLDTQVRRYERPDGHKDYKQYHPDVSGKLVPGAGPIQFLLYRYNDIKDLPKNRPILFVEGEKAVDACVSKGIPATCNIGGALKWNDSYNTMLAGRRIIIIPDNDPATDEKGKEHLRGQKHAKMVFDKLSPCCDVKLMPVLPDVGEKGDIYDWFEQGHSIDELINWTKTVEWKNMPKHRYHESELEQVPPVEWLLKPFIQDRAINMLSGESGTGKSFIAVHWAKEMGRTMNVLYLAAEDHTQYPERVKAWNTYHKFDPKDGHFYLETRPMNLINDTDTDRIIADNTDIHPRFVVIDTYAAATAGSNENDNGQIEIILGNARRFISEWNCAVLIVHHFNKAGTAERGGSALRGGIVQAMQAHLDLDTVKIEMDKTRNAELAADIFYKFEKVSITVKLSDGTTEIRQQQVPVPTDHAEVDMLNLSSKQESVLKWLGAMFRRDQEHATKNIEAGTNINERTVSHALNKLKSMGMVSQAKERGPYRVTHEGLIRSGYIENNLRMYVQEVPDLSSK